MLLLLFVSGFGKDIIVAAVCLSLLDMDRESKFQVGARIKNKEVELSVAPAVDPGLNWRWTA